MLRVVCGVVEVRTGRLVHTVVLTSILIQLCAQPNGLLIGSTSEGHLARIETAANIADGMPGGTHLDEVCVSVVASRSRRLMHLREAQSHGSDSGRHEVSRGVRMERTLATYA